MRIVTRFENYFQFTLLFSCQLIFIIGVVVRAVVVCSLQKSVHFVLVEINEAGVALVLLVVNIIYAFIAVWLHITSELTRRNVIFAPIFQNNIRFNNQSTINQQTALQKSTSPPAFCTKVSRALYHTNTTSPSPKSKRKSTGKSTNLHLFI